MIRRLRLACVGLGAFMLPACMGNNQLSDPYYTGGGPGYVLMNRPGVPPGQYQRQGPAASATDPKANAPVAEQKFGPVAHAARPKPETSQEIVRQPKALEPPPQIIVPVVDRQPKPEPAADVESPLADRKWPKIVVGSSDEPKDIASPKNLIAPKWPQLGPTVAEPTPANAPNLLPPLDMPPPAAHQPAPSAQQPPVVAPPPEPVRPAPMGTSMKVGEPITSVAASTHSGDESTLIRAMKAFQSNRPDEAVDLLKRLDPSNQEVLLYLMPLMLRLSEGNLNNMTSDELAMLVDRLQTASGMLKSRATLRIDRAVFCRGVRKFADIDPYDLRHEFKAGDMVFLYAELKNFTCEPVQQAALNNVGSNREKGFNIRLGASLELRDARNSLVWRTDLSKSDFTQTPPQDYYHTYRFCVPEKLPPGTYTLWLTVIDKPSNRAIRKPVEMRVGQ